MADHTKIEWTDATWNPITGCSVVSAGCKHCYAMRLAGGRLKHHPSREGLTRTTVAGAVWNGQVRLNETWMEQPLRWKRPRRIFVCAHGDLFHEAVPDGWIDKVFAIMARTPQHTFQVLTKRAERMRLYMEQRTALRNVWMGVSAENQDAAEQRIVLLLETNACVRFVSLEPLLGPIDLTDLDGEAAPNLPRDFWTCVDNEESPPAIGVDSLRGERWQRFGDWSERGAKLDWVIVGGESGAGARPVHPDWVRSLRDQCGNAGVPLYFKQWGNFLPDSMCAPDQIQECRRVPLPGNRRSSTGMVEVGKRAAGRQLDGETHEAFPRFT